MNTIKEGGPKQFNDHHFIYRDIHIAFEQILKRLDDIDTRINRLETKNSHQNIDCANDGNDIIRIRTHDKVLCYHKDYIPEKIYQFLNVTTNNAFFADVPAEIMMDIISIIKFSIFEHDKIYKPDFDILYKFMTNHFNENEVIIPIPKFIWTIFIKINYVKFYLRTKIWHTNSYAYN